MSKSPSQFVPRSRKVRILATLGPASATPDMIRTLRLRGTNWLWSVSEFAIARPHSGP